MIASGLMLLGQEHTKLFARAVEAEQEAADLKALIVQHFHDKLPGAETFLREIAADNVGPRKEAA